MLSEFGTDTHPSTGHARVEEYDDEKDDPTKKTGKLTLLASMYACIAHL